MIKELLETITSTDVKLDTKAGKVKVSITLATRNSGVRDRGMSVTPARARRVLGTRGIHAGELLSSPVTITNVNDTSLKGTWEFALAPDASTTEETPKTRRSRKTTSRAKPKASTAIETPTATDAPTEEESEA
jgi:hypothetical protein